MVDDFLRPVKERVLDPFCRRFAYRIHPNTITIVAFLFGIGSCVWIVGGRLKIALAFGAVNRILDGIDGTVARISNRQSDFGGYLDIMLDVVLYTLVPFAFVYYLAPLYPRQPLAFGLATLLGAFYLNLASWTILSAILEKRKSAEGRPETLTSVAMPRGVIEGTETMIFFALFYLLPRYVFILFFVMAALSIVGAAQRFVWAARNIR